MANQNKVVKATTTATDLEKSLRKLAGTPTKAITHSKGAFNKEEGVQGVFLALGSAKGTTANMVGYSNLSSAQQKVGTTTPLGSIVRKGAIVLGKSYNEANLYGHCLTGKALPNKAHLAQARTMAKLIVADSSYRKALIKAVNSRTTQLSKTGVNGCEVVTDSNLVKHCKALLTNTSKQG